MFSSKSAIAIGSGVTEGIAAGAVSAAMLVATGVLLTGL